MIESAVAVVMILAFLAGCLVYLGCYAFGMIWAWFHPAALHVPACPPAPQRKGANMRHMETFE